MMEFKKGVGIVETAPEKKEDALNCALYTMARDYEDYSDFMNDLESKAREIWDELVASNDDDALTDALIKGE